ncbi:hypothetical protein [Bradyrhizobium sp. CCGE-LA001]
MDLSNNRLGRLPSEIGNLRSHGLS